MGFESLNESQFFKQNRMAVPGRVITWLSNDKLTPDNMLTDGQLTTYPQEIYRVGAAYSRYSTVVGAHVFYNGSSWDSSSDDAAIATDKEYLPAGAVGGYSNVTNYTKGINGIIIDIVELGLDELSASDFSFKVGNDNNPLGWSDAPAPESIVVRPEAGAGGSDRVVIIWADDSIANTWLEVRLLASGNTRVQNDFPIYFGNLIGEVDGDLSVTASDVVAISGNVTPVGAASLTNRYDVNRDKTVSSADIIAARDNQGSSLNAISP